MDMKRKEPVDPVSEKIWFKLQDKKAHRLKNKILSFLSSSLKKETQK